jgi:outer membrane receptor protein involved in Fe transport
LFPTLNGNANLKPETADTYTAGVVLSSPFETPFLKRLRLTVDYYNIRVNDAIGAQSVDIAQRQCFDTAFNPTLSADSAFCNGVINRNTNGGLGNVITTFLNSGRFRTSGIDFQLDWTVPVGPGQLNVNSVMNYLLYTKSAELPVLPLVDYTGTLGTTQNGLNGGAYEWRLSPPSATASAAQACRCNGATCPRSIRKRRRSTRPTRSAATRNTICSIFSGPSRSTATYRCGSAWRICSTRRPRSAA